MSVLLSVYSSTRFLGSCNANCYDGKNPSELHDKNEHFPCSCICGGRNHAVGLTRALKNVAQGVGLSRADLEAYAQYRDLNIDDLLVIDRTRIISDYMARQVAKARLNPVPVGPDDLFYCEALTASDPLATVEGSGGGGQQTPTPAGRPSEVSS